LCECDELFLIKQAIRMWWQRIVKPTVCSD